jgi:hypothetical protein
MSERASLFADGPPDLTRRLPFDSYQEFVVMFRMPEGDNKWRIWSSEPTLEGAERSKATGERVRPEHVYKLAAKTVEWEWLNA